MGAVVSSDGTKLQYDVIGEGPSLLIVDGAMCMRGFGPSAGLADAVGDSFSVFTYDRRGRGQSGNTTPYWVEREIDDIDALITECGGSAFVYGYSSGAALALRAADRLQNNGRIRKLALYEPPYEMRPDTKWNESYLLHLRQALVLGRHHDAVALSMSGLGLCPESANPRETTPAILESLARTLEYDALVMDGNFVPVELASRLRLPVLVMSGSASYDFMQEPSRLLAATLPDGHHRQLDGETHLVKPDALAPVLKEFFR